VAWNGRCVSLCPAIGWDGGLVNFLPGGPCTEILQTSASQITRIIGMNHQHPAVE
jgi:hypothetical protein